MATIDAKTVAELRKRTGLPMMKCKAALVEADGDVETATTNLRKQGVKAAENIAHREAKDGAVFTKLDAAGACAVALTCQTDFVARAEDIVKFGNELAERLWESAPADTGIGESLGEFRMGDGETVEKTLQAFALKIRENIKVADYARFKADNSHVGTYVHHTQKIATLVEIGGAENDAALAVLASDLCMHLAFHGEVQVLSRDQLDPEWIAKEKEIFTAQVQDQPEERRAKIEEGKLAKRMKEVVLLDQPFIKDEKKSVKQAIDEVGAKIGKTLELRRFARIAVGG